ncbi:MAG: 3D domain-containing protein [Candidatus Nealsonbacteria bacterium]|nr:3D domain-containing protein [Candidatus Nealsonbacteria bacterium]
MDPDRKHGFSPSGKAKITLLGVLIALLSLPVLPVFAPSSSLAEAEGSPVLATPTQVETAQAPVIQENSFLPSSEHYLPKPEATVLEKIDVVVTAYSSSVWETDDTPYLTAANTLTRDGVVASNLLPFGTKIRIPELFGEKTFVIEDRMNKRVGDFQIDIWFPTAWEAKQFGVKYTHIETIR